MSQKLSLTDRNHVECALGWLELGNPAEAATELAHISAEGQRNPLVLKTHWRVEAGAGRWIGCVAAALELTTQSPDACENWVLLGRALREAGKPDEAYVALSRAAGRFRDDIAVRVELALVCAQLGREIEGGTWMARAETLRRRKKAN